MTNPSWLKLDEKQLVRAVQNNPRFVVDLLYEMDKIRVESALALCHVPLTSEENIKQANMLQGRVVGIELAVDLITEALEPEQENEYE